MEVTELIGSFAGGDGTRGAVSTAARAVSPGRRRGGVPKTTDQFRNLHQPGVRGRPEVLLDALNPIHLNQSPPHGRRPSRRLILSNIRGSQPRTGRSLDRDGPLAIGDATGALDDRHHIGRHATITVPGIGTVARDASSRCRARSLSDSPAPEWSCWVGVCWSPPAIAMSCPARTTASSSPSIGPHSHRRPVGLPIEMITAPQMCLRRAASHVWFPRWAAAFRSPRNAAAARPASDPAARRSAAATARSAPRRSSRRSSRSRPRRAPG